MSSTVKSIETAAQEALIAVASGLTAATTHHNYVAITTQTSVQPKFGTKPTSVEEKFTAVKRLQDTQALHNQTLLASIALQIIAEGRLNDSKESESPIFQALLTYPTSLPHLTSEMENQTVSPPIQEFVKTYREIIKAARPQPHAHTATHNRPSKPIHAITPTHR